MTSAIKKKTNKTIELEENAIHDQELDVNEPLLPSARSKKHRARRNFCCKHRVVIITMVGIMVIFLGLFIVQSQMNNIATNAIENTKMMVESMQLTDPKKESLALTIALTLQSPSAFPVKISPSVFAIIYNHTQVGHFMAPEMQITHGLNRQIFSNTRMNITNMDSWNRFAQAIVQKEKIAYEIHGKIMLQVKLLGGLINLYANDVSLLKSLQIVGMNGLSKLLIGDMDLKTSTPSRVMAKVKSCIYNPSSTTLKPIGSVCMHGFHPIQAKNTLVALLKTQPSTSISVGKNDPSHAYCASFSEDMRLGYNLLELEGIIVGDNSEAISALITKFLAHENADLTVAVCSKNASAFPVYDGALKGLVIRAKLPPRQEALLDQFFFSRINLSLPVHQTENEYVVMDTRVKVEASSPLGKNSPLEISEIHLRVNLYAVENDQQSMYLGQLMTTRTEVIDGTMLDVSNVTIIAKTQLNFEDMGKNFGTFVRSSINNNAVHLRLDGNMSIHAKGALGILKLQGLPVNISTSLSAMEGLSNVSLVDFSLPGDQPVNASTGELITANISIWNPSIFSVNLGALQMELFLPNNRETFGIVNGNMQLVPGSNFLQVSGQLTPTQNTQGHVSIEVSNFFSAYLRGIDTRVSVRVKQLPLSKCQWMQKALLGLEINSHFPGIDKHFQLISDIDIEQLHLRVQKITDPSSISNTEMLMRTDLTSKVAMPESIRIPLTMTEVSISVIMENLYNNSMGTFISGMEKCVYNETGNSVLRLSMSHSYPLLIESTSQKHFMQKFITGMLTKEGNITLILGSNTSQGASPKVETRMGILDLKDLPINDSTFLPAMNSFHNPPISIIQVDIIEGNPLSMLLNMSFVIRNPSKMTTALGKLRFHVLFENVQMGEATIEDFALACCNQTTKLVGTFELKPSIKNEDIVVRFLSNFVSGYFTEGHAQNITIKGYKNSSSFDLLQPALSNLIMASSVPTLAQLFPGTPSLVTSSLLYRPSSIFHLTELATSLELRNPFSENITVKSVNLLLYPCKNQVKVAGIQICHEYYASPLARFAPSNFESIFIPANTISGCFSCCQGSKCQEKIKLCPRAATGHCMKASIESFLSPEAIVALFHTATSGLLMKVNGTINAYIGTYETHLFYQQEGLLVTLASFFS